MEGAERRTGDPLQGLGGLSSVSREPSSFGNYSNVLSETSGERQCTILERFLYHLRRDDPKQFIPLGRCI